MIKNKKLIGGMDVSGTNDNYKYLAIVIGQQPNLISLHKKLGQPKKHMSNQPKRSQHAIIKNLKFDKKNNIAFCVRIERKAIINKVKSTRLAKYKRMSGGKLFAMFEKILFKYLSHEIEKFTLRYGLGARDIVVECDNDSIVFAKTWGVKHINPSNAHLISDVVAWCNNKNESIKGVIELDLTRQIQQELIKKLQK